MPSRPIHRRNTSTPQKQPVDVGPLAQALGVLSVGFGVGLMVLTLAGAADGYAAIGLHDIMVGSMFVAFSYKAIRFGYDVVTGRQTIYGEWA